MPRLAFNAFIIFILLFAVSCKPKQHGLVYYNDFESIKGWSPAYLNKSNHVSGEYSNKLDTSNVYGVTFKIKFKEVTDLKIKKLKISQMVLLNSINSQSNLVVEVTDPSNKKVFYLAKNIEQVVRREKKWVKVEEVLTFPSDAITNPENTISIYSNDIGKSDIYIDNVRIEFVI